MKFAAMMAGVVLMAAGCAPDDAAPREAASMRWPTLDGNPPLVIAHRGASGYLPEHTLEAYALAIDQGADVIEPDLVFTKDGVLVARHDRYLSTTTDVATHPEFADRKKPNADPNDAPRDDWWVEDFTLAELKTLRAVQPFAGRSKDFDGLYEVPTFEEVKALVAARAGETGRPVGVYPETKHPGYFQSIGMDFEAPLLATLDGFDAGPVFIQSFEPDILKRLKDKTDAKLVQLVYEETPGAGPNIPLADIAAYADGVGPEKTVIFFDNQPTSFVEKAHELGLIVHPWTFRADQPNKEMKGPFVVRTKTSLTPKDKEADASSSMVSNEKRNESSGLKSKGDEKQAPTMGHNLIYIEYDLFFELGVDGVFTDFPDRAVKARADYLQETQ